ncbi:carbohydrate ABC transporter permease [Microlunatus soli]|uniref:Multiple sugar transport system permease protein n=1 Tax=Microlunatus soli TaxID=630515 RepID=A0A1H1RUI9_9ACTN|nr:carbohydrate ABC transporter permease [Microlunatus soli]SDS39360.1 multiple sugar transport system permease protein [Microlunatus soli]
MAVIAGRLNRPSTRGHRMARAETVLLALVGVLLGFGTLFPLLWMAASGLKTENEVLTHPLSLIPHDVQWANLGSALHTVGPYLVNSLKLAVINVVGVLAVSSLAGYAFARLEFAGKNILFVVVLATTMVPSIAYLLPQYLMFDQWDWTDTHLPLWVPRVMTPVFGTFLMRQAFRVLPQELEDAARVDGAGLFTIYWRILLPLTKPALAAIGVLTFVESWNDLFGPLIFINSTELQTLPAALALFKGQFFTQINLLMAAATISVVPVLIIYFIGQRYLVEGIANTGTTG